ncbi:dynamin family protein [Succinivibrio dextrinosolvens]|uniref:dynamin family protein n=1 Tax=Succinivibrio dextrinosolvens TaxID=83771 RepID=UPI0019215BD4|nr:dynamin family protein [Succinivibrio dextrinosolvens]
MISSYNERKKEVLKSYSDLEFLITELKDYSNKIQLPDPFSRMEELLKDIRGKSQRVKDDRFSIIIAGESKSGKSTFINAYLGAEILPMDVKQCTSSIVVIKYGETFSVNATYADGRKIEITGDQESRDFLKKNASIDNDYRDIPVPTINNEILVKAGLRSIHKNKPLFISNEEIENMLNAPEVIAANIYNKSDYNARIKQYINEKKNSWRDLVTKIEVYFPFPDKDFQGIEIIDSPGVCARGGVSDITSNYIINADAIIFLKPVVGQALESEQFNQFLESTSVSRNRNALFLVLTHIATKNEADLQSLEKEANKIFSGKLKENNILFVDSKSELYAKKFDKLNSIEDVKKELKKLNEEKTLDDFVVKAFTQTSGLFGNSEDKADFINILKTKSRFEKIYTSLETFGRKAHYILLHDLLDAITRLYEKLLSDMNSNIELFKQKAEDPNELAAKIADIKSQIDVIQNKLYKETDLIVRRFQSDEGIIRKKAEEEVKTYLETINGLKEESNESFDLLEKETMKKMDMVKSFTLKLQKDIVAEFDKELVELSDKTSIDFVTLQPILTYDTINQIKESTRKDANITKSYEEGVTFKSTHYYSAYDKGEHYKLVKNHILDKFKVIKNDLIQNAIDFVEGIRDKYIDELKKNGKAKKELLDSVIEAKVTAEQNQEIIKTLIAKKDDLVKIKSENEKLKGGLERYVYSRQ